MNPQLIFVAGSGCVCAFHAHDTTLAWEVVLKPGWFKTGHPFVSLLEHGDLLYAFAYGKLYRLRKLNGEILGQSEDVKSLKNGPAVFATPAPSAAEAAIAQLLEAERQRRIDSTDQHNS